MVITKFHWLSRIDLRVSLHIGMAHMSSVMTFGFKNATSHFYCSIDLMLNDLLYKCVLVYMDNILIHSRSKQDYFEHVK